GGWRCGCGHGTGGRRGRCRLLRPARGPIDLAAGAARSRTVRGELGTAGRGCARARTARCGGDAPPRGAHGPPGRLPRTALHLRRSRPRSARSHPLGRLLRAPSTRGRRRRASRAGGRGARLAPGRRPPTARLRPRADRRLCTPPPGTEDWLRPARLPIAARAFHNGRSPPRPRGDRGARLHAPQQLPDADALALGPPARAGRVRPAHQAPRAALPLRRAARHRGRAGRGRL
ncbi:MAG: hypothetical protein AVDCRST_MAG18-666, partial [uncultured Thermomicrobiales bacterium]